FITHDISVVSETCTTIIVMYGGRIMEKATRRGFFKNPYHPYSLGLQKAFPSITEMDEKLVSIPGSPPNLINPEPGCRFRSRCPFATEKCKEMPPLVDVEEDHFVACHYTDKVEEFRKKAADPSTWVQQRQKIDEQLEEGVQVSKNIAVEEKKTSNLKHTVDSTFIEVANLKKHYDVSDGIFKKSDKKVRAVDNISFTINKGEILG